MINALNLADNGLLPHDYHNPRELKKMKTPFFGFVRGIVKIKDVSSTHFPYKEQGNYEFKLIDIIDSSKFINVLIDTKNMPLFLYITSVSSRKIRYEIVDGCKKRINNTYPHLKSDTQFEVVVILQYDNTTLINNMAPYAECNRMYLFNEFNTYYNNNPPQHVFDTLDKYGLEYTVYDHDCVTFNTTEHEQQNSIHFTIGYLTPNEWGGSDDEEYEKRTGGYLYGLENVDIFQFKEVLYEIKNEKYSKFRHEWRYSNEQMCDYYDAYIECKIREEPKNRLKYDEDIIQAIVLVCSDNIIDMVCFDVETFKKEFWW